MDVNGNDPKEGRNPRMQERNGCGSQVPSRWEGMPMSCSSFVTKEKVKDLNPKSRELVDLVGKFQDVLLWSCLFSQLESRSSAERENQWGDGRISGKNGRCEMVFSESGRVHWSGGWVGLPGTLRAPYSWQSCSWCGTALTVGSLSPATFSAEVQGQSQPGIELIRVCQETTGWAGIRGAEDIHKAKIIIVKLGDKTNKGMGQGWWI